jgi:hypothetical protein
MNRRERSIILICVMGIWLLILSCIPKSTTMDKTQPMPSSGCSQCHKALSETLPQNHVNIRTQDIKYCAMCHGLENKVAPFEWIAHYPHYTANGFEGDCWSCHFMNKEGNFGVIGSQNNGRVDIDKDGGERLRSFFDSWASSEYLDCVHAEARVSCSSCHAKFSVEEDFPVEVCLKCHGSYADMALVTKDTEPNPHESHLGEINCTFCHKVHEPSMDLCEQCHAFDYKVP